MTQRAGRWVALAVLALMLGTVLLGPALGAGGFQVYAPLVRKDRTDGVVAPTAQATPAATSVSTTTPTVEPTVEPTTTPTVTPEPTPPGTLTLAGQVALKPLMRSSDRPRNYVVLLDASGSMNWNFLGQAIIDGLVRQCGAGPNEELNQRRAQDAAFCNATSYSSWSPVEERRSYIAKQELIGFIEQLRPEDRMYLIAFSGSRLNAVGATGLGDAAGKTVMKQAVLDAGATGGEPYLMSGGTTTASALYVARQLLSNPATPRQAPNGQDYEQVVRLLTDGVANHYRDLNNGRYLVNDIPVGWNNTASDQGSICLPNPSETVACQLGYAETTVGLVARPITAMVHEAMELKDSAEVFVIPMAGVDTTGLISVASRSVPPWFAETDYAETLDDALDAIGATAALSETATWVDRIDPERVPDPQALPGVDATTFGVVTAYGWDGLPVASAPIQADPDSGALVYRFEGLHQSTYTLRAWIGYRSSDGVTRRYRLISDGQGGAGAPALPLDLSTLPAGSQTRQDLFLVR